jgi:hypothetical protein
MRVRCFLLVYHYFSWKLRLDNSPDEVHTKQCVNYIVGQEELVLQQLRLVHLGYVHIIGNLDLNFTHDLSVMLAWVCVYFVYCFQSSLPWTGKAEEFFQSNVLQSSHDVTGISWPVFGGLAFVWLVVYICVWRGVKSTGFVAYVTVPLPILLLVILLGRALFLEGNNFFITLSKFIRCIYRDSLLFESRFFSFIIW